MFFFGNGRCSALLSVNVGGAGASSQGPIGTRKCDGVSCDVPLSWLDVELDIEFGLFDTEQDRELVQELELVVDPELDADGSDRLVDEAAAAFVDARLLVGMVPLVLRAASWPAPELDASAERLLVVSCLSLTPILALATLLVSCPLFKLTLACCPILSLFNHL